MSILEGLFLCPLVKHDDELFQVAESESLVYFSPGRNSFVCLPVCHVLCVRASLAFQCDDRSNDCVLD